jgi:hypothetical protein
MSKEGEEYRIEMLRGLKQENSRPPPREVLEAEQVIAKFREKQANLNAIEARVNSHLPNPDLCPECFYLHNRNSMMHSIPSGGSTDIYKCDTCSFTQKRNPRS